MRVELQSKGFDIGVYQTATLMKQANIRAIRPRKRHVYKTNECEHRIAPNLLKRQFNPTTLHTYFVGDITYIHTHQGWIYLAAVMDLANREIVGWTCSDVADTNLAIRALQYALVKQKKYHPPYFFTQIRVLSTHPMRLASIYKVIISLKA